MKQVKSRTTGCIGELDFDSIVGVFIVIYDDLNTKETVKIYYKSLEDLCKDWEDYKEPRKTWFIDTYGSVRDREAMTLMAGWDDKPIFEFETKEEAEKAAEKLKAWQRLEDKGFRFDFVAVQAGIPEKDGVQYAHRFINIRAIMPNTEAALSSKDDLDLLFGGEK